MTALRESATMLEVRQTDDRGRGVFASAPIARGQLLVACQGWLARSDELQDHWFAMQVAPDLWLCTDGAGLDDCINHSCTPNAGFTTGEPTLHALRDIVVGEEITWDYSTSIAELGWSLECRCGSEGCRQIVRSWGELTADERERLRSIALRFLR
jgi:SET domain-containing protein